MLRDQRVSRVLGVLFRAAQIIVGGRQAQIGFYSRVENPSVKTAPRSELFKADGFNILR